MTIKTNGAVDQNGPSPGLNEKTECELDISKACRQCAKMALSLAGASLNVVAIEFLVKAFEVKLSCALDNSDDEC